MKRIMLTIAATLLVAVTFGQATAAVANYNKLPKAAKDLLSTNFKNDKVVFVEIDMDLASVEYDVQLQSGTEINFNSKGEWEEIDTKVSPIPANLIHKEIKTYVDTHYKGMNIVKMERDGRKIDIELNNGLDLVFDANGKFVRIDD